MSAVKIPSSISCVQPYRGRNLLRGSKSNLDFPVMGALATAKQAGEDHELSRPALINLQRLFPQKKVGCAAKTTTVVLKNRGNFVDMEHPSVGSLLIKNK